MLQQLLIAVYIVPADESPTVLKERAVASSNFVGINNIRCMEQHFTFPSGVESPFAIGDTIEVTGTTVGFNTSKALVTGIVPINYGSSGFDASSQSGGVTNWCWFK